MSPLMTDCERASEREREEILQIQHEGEEGRKGPALAMQHGSEIEEGEKTKRDKKE